MGTTSPSIPISSSQADLATTFLREQRNLLQELIGDVESSFMSRNTIQERIAQIESNLRKLRNLI